VKGYRPGRSFTKQSGYMVYSRLTKLWRIEGGALCLAGDRYDEKRSLFVLDFDSGLFSMSELCERYGISRPTGYKWWARYRTEDCRRCRDRSRRAQSCPHRTMPRWRRPWLLAPCTSGLGTGDVAAAPEDARWRICGCLRRPPRPYSSSPRLIVARKPRPKRVIPGRPYVKCTPQRCVTADFKGEFLTRDHATATP